MWNEKRRIEHMAIITLFDCTVHWPMGHRAGGKKHVYVIQKTSNSTHGTDQYFEEGQPTTLPHFVRVMWRILTSKVRPWCDMKKGSVSHMAIIVISTSWNLIEIFVFVSEFRKSIKSYLWEKNIILIIWKPYNHWTGKLHFSPPKVGAN